MAAVEAMLQDAGLANKSDAPLRGCRVCLLRVGIPVPPEEAAARVAVAASELRHISFKVCRLLQCNSGACKFLVSLLKKTGQDWYKLADMLHNHAELITLDLQLLSLQVRLKCGEVTDVVDDATTHLVVLGPEGIESPPSISARDLLALVKSKGGGGPALASLWRQLAASALHIVSGRYTNGRKVDVPTGGVYIISTTGSDLRP